MHITYIAAGAAGTHCGACERDAALVRALRAQGHDAQLVPLYTPLRVDGDDPSLNRVFYGGINTFLQQHLALFRGTPRFVDWLLDRPSLLSLVSRMAIKTQPEGLGEMTVSVLRGEDGKQRKELDRLVCFLERQPKPDIVNLTNSLLLGVAAGIKQRLGVPVVCTLQGEESFVARLPQPHRDEAWALLREHAQHADMFCAPGEAYADEMSEALCVPRDRFRTVMPGIDLSPYAVEAQRSDGPFCIGFLSQISPVKGLDVLVDAFHTLKEDSPGDAVLAVAGETPPSSQRFWDEQVRRLAAWGLADRVEFVGKVDLHDKVHFLKNCSVFCLPSRIAERRGVACIEALAAGVPIVVPDRGVFSEMVALTGGGVLVPPDDPRALAEALASLRNDPDGADDLGRAGASGVAEHFSAKTMAAKTLAVYEEVVASNE